MSPGDLERTLNMLTPTVDHCVARQQQLDHLLAEAARYGSASANMRSVRADAEDGPSSPCPTFPTPPPVPDGYCRADVGASFSGG
jgi:hypothetical protein